MATWNDLIDRAFTALGVIRPGDSITTGMRTHAQGLVNQLLGTLSTEGATAYTQKTYSKNLITGVSGYTVGSGGSIDTGERVERIMAWDARSGDMAKGGPVLPLDAFGAAMQAEQERIAGIALQAVLAGQLSAVPGSITAPVPSIVGADTAFPLINLRVFPAPSANTAIVLAGWTPITAVADFTVTPTLPAGWEDLIVWGSAVELYPTYARVSTQTLEAVASAYANAKGSIVNQNTAGKPAGGPQQ